MNLVKCCSGREPCFKELNLHCWSISASRLQLWSFIKCYILIIKNASTHILATCAQSNQSKQQQQAVQVARKWCNGPCVHGIRLSPQISCPHYHSTANLRVRWGGKGTWLPYLATSCCHLNPVQPHPQSPDYKISSTLHVNIL